MSEILVTRHAGWASITFNRPERRNAIDFALAQRFRDALIELNADAELRAIVLQGAGGAFCSGMDIKAFNTDPPPPWRAQFMSLWDEVHRLLLDCPKVLIGAIQGGAINGGAAVALAADISVVGRKAFIHVGEAQVGMGAPRNISWLVLKHGEAVAMRFALLADRVGADELLRLGVATEVVDEEQVLARAESLAGRIGGFPPGGVLAAKVGIRRTAMRMTAPEWFLPAAEATPSTQFVPKAVR